MGETKNVALLLRQLNEGLYEKEHVMALAFLAAVAGESLFLLGPPGTAKSMLARRLKYAFRHARSFEYLMSRFSTPDEIFGPVSVSALKDENRYVRLTEGYLPEADVVFLDEIWKAGPSIQNALLTVLNEKIYLNGNTPLQLPLKLLVAASNELPAEGENLEALWDRFLIRYWVEGISSPVLFNRMIASSSKEEVKVDEALCLSEEELLRWSDGIDAVEIPSCLFDYVHKFRKELITYNLQKTEEGEERVLYVSDRRWKKIVRLWRSSAFLQAASKIHWADTLLILHCAWDFPDQLGDLQTIWQKAIASAWEEETGISLLKERLEALRGECQVRKKSPEDTDKLKVVKAFYYQVCGVAGQKQVLVYTNEYDRMSEGETAPFILVFDKYKTGAQILKKYDKSRYPNVFQKDILQVKKGNGTVEVSGKVYSLARQEHTEERAGELSLTKELPGKEQRELLERITAEYNEAFRKFESFREEESNYAGRHLFLDASQKDMLNRAIRHIQLEFRALHVEIQEIAHAFA